MGGLSELSHYQSVFQMYSIVPQICSSYIKMYGQCNIPAFSDLLSVPFCADIIVSLLALNDVEIRMGALVCPLLPQSDIAAILIDCVFKISGVVHTVFVSFSTNITQTLIDQY